MRTTIYSNMNQLFNAMQLINDFCKNEYDSYADFEDMEKVAIAHSTVGPNDNDRQVYIDLINYRKIIETFGYGTRYVLYETLEALINQELEHMTFDDLIYS